MLKTQTQRLLDGVNHTIGEVINPLPHCVAPYKGISIDPAGNVFPDAVYGFPLGNLYEKNLKEIWNGEEWKKLRQDQMSRTLNSGCEDCHKKELLVGHSRRRFFETFFMYRLDKEKLEPVTDSEGRNLSLRPKVEQTEEPNFLYLDVSTSNKCNLKCIHCRGAVSTGWIPDEKKLIDLGLDDLRSPRYGAYSMDDAVIEKIFEFPEFFKDLNFVALRGGEPSYEAKNKLLLKKLIDLGWNNQITIDISTNATVNDEEFFNLLDQFQSVMLYVSIEGVNKMYEYCRGGKNYNIDVLEKMIFKYANLRSCEICITYTTMAPNVFNIFDTWNWMQTYKDYCTFSFTNTVSKPNYLSFSVLNNDMRKQAYDMIKDINEELNWPNSQSRTYEPGIGRIASKLKDEQESDWNEQWIDFKRYIEALDKIRQTDFLSVEPLFKKYWSL